MLLSKFSLTNKIAIVTGGGSGIGRATALTFAEAGADVTVVDINLEAAQHVADEVKSLGRRAQAIRTDVTSRDEVSKMVGKTLDSFGRIDVLDNNAGTTELAYVLHDNADEWWRIVERCLEINLKSFFICSRSVGEVMVKQKAGSIVNISSFMGFNSFARAAHYAAAKAGVISLTKSLAVEWGQYNIRVNSIAPGVIATPLALKVARDDSKRRQEQFRSIPLGRLGKPEEVATVALFLVSEASSYITGQTIPLTGGQTTTEWTWD